MKLHDKNTDVYPDAGRSSVLRRYSMELIDKNATERALTMAAASGKDKDRRTWAKAICVLHDMPVVSPVAHSRWRECREVVEFLSQLRQNDGLGGGDHR